MGNTKKNLKKLAEVGRVIVLNRLPLVPTAKLVIRNLSTKKVPLAVMAYTPYLTRPHPEEKIRTEDTYISRNEFICRGADLNDLSMRPLMKDKVNLFTRLGEQYMGRTALNPAEADDAEITEFLQRHGKIVGKKNSAGGDGFQIYSAEAGDTVEKIRADGVAVLEPYIRQHPAYQEIYPGSVNTLRIHTIRNSRGIRVLCNPKLRVGSDGAKVDVAYDAITYRVLLDPDGRILCAGKNHKRTCVPCTEHHNTGYRFQKGKKLPYVREAINLCLDAARLTPEVRFVGWDIAVTEHGPIIVEANDLSIFIETYQQAKQPLTGIGVRHEAEELFSWGTEGVTYAEDTVFFCEPFAPVVARLPEPEELFLILLQGALHRHGVEFFEREYSKPVNPETSPCLLRYEKDQQRMRIERNGHTAYVPLSVTKAAELYPYAGKEPRMESLCALDRIAMHEAALIYQAMVLGCGSVSGKAGLVAYARFCSRLHNTYVWSAMGQRVDEKLLTHLRTEYPEHYSPEKMKWIAGLQGTNIYAFDCSGLIKSYYLGGLGAPNYENEREKDLSSEMMYSQAVRKGDLAELPEEPGLCLYMPGHVGIYLGDHTVLDSSCGSGETGGVRLSKLEDKNWRAWFECPLEDSAPEPSPE